MVMNWIFNLGGIPGEAECPVPFPATVRVLLQYQHLVNNLHNLSACFYKAWYSVFCTRLHFSVFLDFCLLKWLNGYSSQYLLPHGTTGLTTTKWYLQ